MSSSISLLNGPNTREAAGKLDPGILSTLDALFALYHKRWWCHREMFYHFKRRHTLLNALALLILAAGMVVGPVLENSIIVATLTAAGTVVKGWNEFKKFSHKVNMCRFAYTTYAKTLIELRLYVLGMPLDELKGFLTKMQTLDDTITDFASPVTDKCSKAYDTKFRYVKVEEQEFHGSIKVTTASCEPSEQHGSQKT